jgi:hypothetical protein
MVQTPSSIALEEDFVPEGSESRSSLHLELHISEPVVLQFLERFDMSAREEKALEALRVGVIAIQSASPTLDTRVVEQKFQEVKLSLDDCIGGFREHLKGQMEEYFKPSSGSVPRTMDVMFGESGKVTQLFNQYFAPSDGRVLRLLESQIGPQSQFAKSLDPENRQSVVARIEELVKKQLEEESKAILQEFSLDAEESALSRLQSRITQEIEGLKVSQSKFFAEVKTGLGVKEAKAAEAEKGTEKGREFEVALYERIAEMGRLLEDSTNNVRAIVGSLPRSKKGDYVITLGDTSGAPGQKIVIEAKTEKDIKLNEGIEELKGAKQNREAASGILAFAKGCEPPEIGDFLRIGQDFFVTVDEEALKRGEPLLFLEAAYKITRATMVTISRLEEKQEIDLASVRSEIESLNKLAEKISDISTKANTVKNNGEAIKRIADDLQGEFESRLKIVVGLLDRGRGESKLNGGSANTYQPDVLPF